MNFSLKKCETIFFLLPFILILVFIGLDFKPITDEAHFHLPVVLNLKGSVKAILPPEYNITSPPLPHILMFFWGRIFGYTFLALRALTLILSVVGFTFFYSLTKKLNSTNPLEATLALVFFPYIFLHSFTIYTINYGLAFGLIFLWFYFKKEEKNSNLIYASVFSTFAILSRQFYVAYPAGAILVELYKAIIAKRLRREQVNRILILLLPIMVLAAVFLYWGGFVSPSQSGAYKLHFSPVHITFFFIFVGFYFWVTLFVVPSKSTLRACTLVAISLLPLFFIFRPRYFHGFKSGMGEGIILRISEIISQKFSPILGTIFLFVFFIIGVIVIFRAILNFNMRNSFLFFALAVLVFIESSIPYVWERLWVSSFPVLVLLLFQNVEKRLYILRFWLIIEMCLAFLYAGLKMSGLI